MSFSTSPKDSPSPVPGPLNAAPILSARERAIAKLTAQAQQTPVQNATQVEPEEMSAIVAKKPEDEEVAAPTPEEPKAEAAAPESERPLTNEPPKTQEPAKPAEEPLSAQYAQLARKEKALRMQAQQLKAQQAALEAQQAEIKAKESEYQGNYIPKDRLSKDTIRVLEEAGISYDQITEQFMNAPSSPEARQTQILINQLKAEIESLKQGQKSTQETIENSQKAAYQQALNQIKNEAKHLVYSSDDFETVKATNSVDDVVELITKTFEKDGILLTVEEAAKAVEEHLEEEAFKLANLKKIQKRLAQGKVDASTPAAPAGKQADTALPKQQPPIKTLTNSVGTPRKLSSRERAILAMKGELKS